MHKFKLGDMVTPLQELPPAVRTNFSSYGLLHGITRLVVSSTRTISGHDCINIQGTTGDVVGLWFLEEFFERISAPLLADSFTPEELEVAREIIGGDV